MNDVPSFRGEYRFLSNFYPVEGGVLFEGRVYPTSEHAFVAGKTLVDRERAEVARLVTAGQAKRYGRRSITPRPDWEEVKLDVMLTVLRAKFSCPWLACKLLATEDLELVERNSWRDTYWGVCNGRGENHLGRLLMQVRQEIKDKGTGIGQA